MNKVDVDQINFYRAVEKGKRRKKVKKHKRTDFHKYAAEEATTVKMEEESHIADTEKEEFFERYILF